MAPNTFQLSPAMLPRGSFCELAHDGRFDGAAELGVVGHQDRLGGGVVLGLRQQVGGDPFRVVVLVGDDQHLGGAGDAVDADGAEHLPLGGGDIGVAGADDLGDGRDASRCRRRAPPTACAPPMR